MKNALIACGLNSRYVDLLPKNRAATRKFLKSFTIYQSKASDTVKAFLDRSVDGPAAARGARALAVWTAACRHVATVNPHSNRTSSALSLQAEAALVLFAQICLSNKGIVSAFDQLHDLDGFWSALEDAFQAFSLPLELSVCEPLNPGDDWHMSADGLIDDDYVENDPWSEVPISLGVGIGCKKEELIDHKARKAIFQTCLKAASHTDNGYTEFGQLSVIHGTGDKWKKMLAFMDAPTPRRRKPRKLPVRQPKRVPLFADLPMAS